MSETFSPALIICAQYERDEAGPFMSPSVQIIENVLYPNQSFPRSQRPTSAQGFQRLRLGRTEMGLNGVWTIAFLPNLLMCMCHCRTLCESMGTRKNFD